MTKTSMTERKALLSIKELCDYLGIGQMLFGRLDDAARVTLNDAVSV